MKILVTVGTTSFDSMIELVDNSILKINVECEVIFQIAGGSYVPKSGECFKFLDKINDYYIEFDLVITHAGAGTVFKLLELNKLLIIIPNLERVDKHQLDLAEYMYENKHAMVLWNPDELVDLIQLSSQFKPVPLTKDKFFAYDDIVDFILN